jgi:sugar O-acyltransferase (sialic acid O-acetyltransferase NeuD family)
MTTSSPLYAIYGASGFGREVIPVARRMLHATLGDTGWELVFVDDATEAEIVNGHRVVTYTQFLAEGAGSKRVCIAIADAAVRQKLAERCRADGIEFFSVVADTAVIMDEVQIGEGAILCPFVTLTSNVRIGRHFHANIYSYVAHDCVVGDFVTFGPAVKCNGNVRVEDFAYVGTGAVLRQGDPHAPLVVGREAVVGMGAVVTRSVPRGATVVGNPARPLTKS